MNNGQSYINSPSDSLIKFYNALSLCMSEELLINVTPMECRVALIENGTVNELYVERTVKRGLVGNIYKGKVVRVLPGMQAAFVDIGLSERPFAY